MAGRHLTHNEQGRVIIGHGENNRSVPTRSRGITTQAARHVAELRLQAYRWDDLDLVFPNTVGKWLDVSDTEHLKRAQGMT